LGIKELSRTGLLTILNDGGLASAGNPFEQMHEHIFQELYTFDGKLQRRRGAGLAATLAQITTFHPRSLHPISCSMLGPVINAVVCGQFSQKLSSHFQTRMARPLHNRLTLFLTTIDLI